MGRQATTIFNPSLGIKYIVKNTKGLEIVGKTLGVKDKKNAPVRSSRQTPKGDEFFKMEIEGDVYTFLNSIKNEVCRTKDGKWEFTGKRPNGRSSLKSHKEEKLREIINEKELEFMTPAIAKMLKED